MVLWEWGGSAFSSKWDFPDLFLLTELVVSFQKEHMQSELGGISTVSLIAVEAQHMD